MYGNVIVALAVILMWELLPSSTGGAGLEFLERVEFTSGLIVSYIILVRTAFIHWKKRRRPSLESHAFQLFHASFVQRFVICGAIVYGLILYWLGWKISLEKLPMGGSDLLRSLLGILPFLLILLGVWAACFPGGRPGLGKMSSYVWDQALLFLPVLVPWTVILAIMDLIRLLAPGLERKLQEDSLWGLGVFAVLLLVLAWGFPTLVIRLWKCSPMPVGKLRELLEDFFQRQGFRYKGVFLWNLLQGSTATAGIMGIFPSSRYVLITPSLLSLLEPQELEAVMAHEIGHVRHLHMVFYLAFMMGLTLILDLCLRAAPWALGGGFLMLEAAGIPIDGWWEKSWLDSSSVGLAASLVFVAVAVVYLRFGFGLFSRNFERQADLYALEIQGNALPLIRSLEKIGGFHPLIRSLPNWHHYSIQERVYFLSKCQQFPAEVSRHHRKVMRLVGGYLFVLLVLLASVIGWRSFHWDRYLSLRFQTILTSRMLQKDPVNPALFFIAGTLAMETGDLARAQEFLQKSLELQPHNPEALNNLAWLYATAQDHRFKDPQKALSLALEAARLKPQEAYILDTLAEAYFQNGYFKEAVETAQKAFSLGGDASEHYRRQLERFQRSLLPEGP